MYVCMCVCLCVCFCVCVSVSHKFFFTNQKRVMPNRWTAFAVNYETNCNRYIGSSWSAKRINRMISFSFPIQAIWIFINVNEDSLSLPLSLQRLWIFEIVMNYIAEDNLKTWINYQLTHAYINWLLTLSFFCKAFIIDSINSFIRHIQPLLCLMEFSSNQT